MTEAEQPILRASRLRYGFPQRRDFLQPIDLEIRGGEFWGIIGPNGAGKSTLLRLLAGLLTPVSGTVLLKGRPLQKVQSRDRARSIAFLPQQMPVDLAATAREIVLMGRYPHRRFGLFESPADCEIADRALAAMGVTALADRALATLSGGEAQRVHVASIIAQEAAVLLLDEPTGSLDLYHQLGIFSLLQEHVRRDSVAAAVVTHDINLAARFCSHVLLLHDGRPLASGPPSKAALPGVLEGAYGVRLASVTVPGAEGQWLLALGARNDERRTGDASRI